MHETKYFSESYGDARARFRDAVLRAGGELVALPIEAKGRNGRDLTIDVGWFGATQPQRAFVHSCGVHGVEAFAGSAIQLAWLDPNRPALDDDQALAFVHPVNPFGMAWMRRVNEHNVDLNRNCLATGEPYIGAPDAYRRLNAFLNPATVASRELFIVKVAWLIARFGFAALKQSIAAGQYEYPQGLFFGGTSLEEGPRRLLDFMSGRLRDARRIVALDVHTGLGEYGTDTYLVDPRTDASVLAAMREAFGRRVVALDPKRGIAYTPRGLYETLLRLAAPGATQVLVGQEFGTHSALKMLNMLRQENREFHYRVGGVSDATRIALTEHFIPADAAWQMHIVQRGVEAIEKLRRLSDGPFARA
jgi:hypothetical protein